MNDVDNRLHRTQSASAIFQKGIYHLYLLKHNKDTEIYAKILRMYQCLFQLCLTHLLLDSSYTLKDIHIPRRLQNEKNIDPAALITHSTFENRQWKGFPPDHFFYPSCQIALELYDLVVDARHNLIYRPFMHIDFWEDCTLIQLLEKSPDISNIEEAYISFWNALHSAPSNNPNEVNAGDFENEVFKPYIGGQRPIESLLLGYARLLSSGDKKLLQEIKSYRNSIFPAKYVSSFWVLDKSFNAGDI